jgi:hypothetical protein
MRDCPTRSAVEPAHVTTTAPTGLALSEGRRPRRAWLWPGWLPWRSALTGRAVGRVRIEISATSEHADRGQGHPRDGGRR